MIIYPVNARLFRWCTIGIRLAVASQLIIDGCSTTKIYQILSEKKKKNLAHIIHVYIIYILYFSVQYIFLCEGQNKIKING